MNNYFELNKKELKQFLFENYKKDTNYNEDLDIKYKLNILKKEKGTEKIIKVKDNKRNRKVLIKVPREIIERTENSVYRRRKKNK